MKNKQQNKVIYNNLNKKQVLTKDSSFDLNTLNNRIISTVENFKAYKCSSNNLQNNANIIYKNLLKNSIINKNSTIIHFNKANNYKSTSNNKYSHFDLHKPNTNISSYLLTKHYTKKK